MYIHIVALTLSFAFLVMLNVSKNRFSKAKYALNAMLIFLFLLTLSDFLIISDYYTPAKYLFIFAFPLLYAIYPTLNIYFRLVIAKGEKITINYNHFLLPFCVFAILVISLFSFSDNDFSLFLNEQTIDAGKSSTKIVILSWSLLVLYLGQFIYYLVSFIQLMQKFSNNLKLLFEFRLVKFIIYAIIFSEITFIVTIFLNQDIVVVDIIVTNLIILLLGIGGLKHDELLLELQISSSLKNNPVLDSERKIKSKISEGKQKQIATEIKEVIKSEKLYLNPNLKLSNFARKLHITERELSIIINDTIGKNFSSFINEFRINEASLLLANNDNRVSDISNRVGFYSRSAFSTTFKEIKGQSPTEYRNSLH